MTEIEAVDRVLKGETECYGHLFHLYGKKAYGLAFQYLRSKEDAMDIVQDAFIKAFQNLRRFDRSRSFGPWFLTIVRNLALDQKRARREYASDEMERYSRDDSLEHQVLKNEMWQAMLRLRREEREVIFLHDYLGHNYADIAAIVAAPVGTVASRLHRGRKELTRLLMRGSDEV